MEQYKLFEEISIRVEKSGQYYEQIFHTLLYRYIFTYVIGSRVGSFRFVNTHISLRRDKRGANDDRSNRAADRPGGPDPSLLSHCST